jgi:hypothetical protein
VRAPGRRLAYATFMPHGTGRARQPTISDKRSNARSAAVSTLRPWSTQSRIRSRGRRFKSCHSDGRDRAPDPESQVIHGAGPVKSLFLRDDRCFGLVSGQVWTRAYEAAVSRLAGGHPVRGVALTPTSCARSWSSRKKQDWLSLWGCGSRSPGLRAGLGGQGRGTRLPVRDSLCGHGVLRP